MDQLFTLLIFMGYFVLVLSAASACGLIGYFVGLFLGWTVALLLHPLIGDMTGQFLVGLFASTGYCLGCVFGAVLTISQISRKAPAPGAEGDVVTVGSEETATGDTAAGGNAEAGDVEPGGDEI